MFIYLMVLLHDLLVRLFGAYEEAAYNARGHGQKGKKGREAYGPIYFSFCL